VIKQCKQIERDDNQPLNKLNFTLQGNRETDGIFLHGTDFLLQRIISKINKLSVLGQNDFTNFSVVCKKHPLARSGGQVS